MKQLRFLIALICLSPLLTFAQERVFLPYFEVINLKADYQYSVSKLLQTYIEDGNKYKLVIYAQFPDLKAALAEETLVAEARKNKCPYYLKGELNRIGEVVIVSLKMYKTDDQSLIWSDRLKASGPEDLDKVVEKLGVNMGSTTKASKDENMNLVTEHQSNALNKVTAEYRFSTGINLVAPLNGYSSSTLYGFSTAGYYDNRNWIGMLRFQYLTSGGSDFEAGDRESSQYIGSIEAYYPLSPKNSTFYVGGGLGICRGSIAKYEAYTNSPGSPTTSYQSEEKAGSGAVINGSYGYIFGRNSSLKGIVSLNLSTSAFKVDGKNLSNLGLRFELAF